MTREVKKILDLRFDFRNGNVLLWKNICTIPHAGQAALLDPVYNLYLLVYLSRYLDHAGESEWTSSVFRVKLLLYLSKHSKTEAFRQVLDKDTIT